MLLNTRVQLLCSGINLGRVRLAEQFSSMTGWQSKEDPAFDAYVSERRRRERYEAFDQRVERGYTAAAKLHKAEIQNAMKRRLKMSGAKFTAETLREVRNSVEERLIWLRDVWAQIDADYRSGDSARQETAAQKISAALRGEPSDYMRWVYETKRELRFAGPVGRRALEEELQAAQLPEVWDEEVNRYNELKLNMIEIEREVKAKYGVAGEQHWAELQAAKDEEYVQKLDDAAEVYKQLLDQSARLDESRRTELQRSYIERVHQAQVRFKAAMELEDQREQLIEAHQAMTEERKRAARERRRDLLREAAELRAQGKNSVEVLTAMKERQLDANARRQAEYELKEQEDILKRKSELLDLIARFKYDVENREGRELLQRQGASSGTAPNVFGFYEGEEAGEVVSSGTEKSSQLSTGETSSTGRALAEGYDKTSETQPSLQQQRSEIWKSINSDTYEDPFRTVHQARLDAVKTYDSTYARTFPLNLVLGRKYSRQGAGEMAAGNEMDRQILQKGNSVAYSFQWGIGSKTVHDLDADGSMDYFMDGSFHVRDKETGDIDWRYEKKSGGAIFRGPKFYRLGAQREAAEAGERTMDPVPRDPNPQRSWRSS